MPDKRADRAELEDAIRAAGLRVTAPRLAVLALLRKSTALLSHAEVVDNLASESWDPATLYRNLNDLVEAKLARRTDLGDHIWRFEVARDGHESAEHPHFLCTECGTVECLPGSALNVGRTKAPRAVKRQKIDVQVRGVCDTCD